jgi:hypothetical protein
VIKFILKLHHNLSMQQEKGLVEEEGRTSQDEKDEPPDKPQDHREAELKVVHKLLVNDVSFRLESPISSMLLVLIIAAICFAFFSQDGYAKSALYGASIVLACAIAYLETKRRP